MTLNAAGLAVVQSWIDDPAANRGIIVKDYFASDGVTVRSSEASTATQRPKLTIAYRPAGAGGQATNALANNALQIDAGPDQRIVFGQPAQFRPIVINSGVPHAALTYKWTLTLGPGPVTFESDTSDNTSVAFSAEGAYTLRLTVDDGDRQAFDELTVIVDPLAA